MPKDNKPTPDPARHDRLVGIAAQIQAGLVSGKPDITPAEAADIAVAHARALLATVGAV